MVSSVILKKVRQTVVSSYHIPSGLLFRPAMTSTPVTTLTTQFRQTTSSGTSQLLMTRSIVPYRSPVTTSMSLVSRFINVKEFHVHISQDDSALVTLITRVIEALDPRGWWYLFFRLDDNSRSIGVRHVFLRTRLRETDEGLCLRLIMHKADRRDVKLSIEDNTLIFEGLKLHGTPQNLNFLLPFKKYQPGDVKARVKNGVLMITFANLKMEDVHKLWADHSEKDLK